MTGPFLGTEPAQTPLCFLPVTECCCPALRHAHTHTVAAPSPRFVLPGSPPRQHRAPVLHIHTIRALLKQPQQRAQDALTPQLFHQNSCRPFSRARFLLAVPAGKRRGHRPAASPRRRRPEARPVAAEVHSRAASSASRAPACLDRRAASGQRPRARGPALPGLPAPPAWRQQAFELTNEAQNQRKTQNTFFLNETQFLYHFVGKPNSLEVLQVLFKPSSQNTMPILRSCF